MKIKRYKNQSSLLPFIGEIESGRKNLSSKSSVLKYSSLASEKKNPETDSFVKLSPRQNSTLKSDEKDFFKCVPNEQSKYGCACGN